MRLTAFLGAWSLERTVEDMRACLTGRLTGTARFTQSPSGLNYSEAGVLVFGDGPALAASRRYLWREASDGALEVRFEDGRFFHRFHPDEPAPAAVHDCPPDRYRVRYDFADWPCWRAEWRVQGPRKNYGMVSTYRPAMAGDA